jgi:hypothetical protein
VLAVGGRGALDPLNGGEACVDGDKDVPQRPLADVVEDLEHGGDGVDRLLLLLAETVDELRVGSDLPRGLLELGVEDGEALLRAESKELLLAVEATHGFAELAEGDIDAVPEDAHVVLSGERARNLGDVLFESFDSASEEVDFRRRVVHCLLVVQRAWYRASVIARYEERGRTVLDEARDVKQRFDRRRQCEEGNGELVDVPIWVRQKLPYKVEEVRSKGGDDEGEGERQQLGASKDRGGAQSTFTDERVFWGCPVSGHRRVDDMASVRGVVEIPGDCVGYISIEGMTRDCDGTNL